MNTSYPLHASETSGPRRGQPQRPTLRTTSLSNAQSLQYGGVQHAQPPLSAVALSSPFSLHNDSPYLATPGGAARGTSPMMRSTTGFSAPYNPQQWGPVGGDGPVSAMSSSNLLASQQRQGSGHVVYASRLRGPDGESGSSRKPRLDF